MDNQELSRELWKTCNAIVAFVVLQTVSFTVLCTTDQFRATLCGRYVSQGVIAALLVFATVGECLIIHWCSRQIRLLDSLGDAQAKTLSARSDIVKNASRGRIAIVGVLVIPAILALLTVNHCRAPASEAVASAQPAERPGVGNGGRPSAEVTVPPSVDGGRGRDLDPSR